MTWSFLAPLYLLGGLALTIPIWVHLRNRRPAQTYAFSTLRFLTRSHVVSHRWRELMRWLVLLLRLAAIAALALAFAQPWKHARIPPSGMASVIVLDVSASMQAGTAWKEAREIALRQLNQDIVPSGTAIVLMGRTPRVLASFDQPNAEKESALKSLQPTFEGTDPQAALNLADRLLAAQPAQKKQIVVISDMAVTAWQTLHWEQPLSPGITLEPHAVATAPPANLGITEVVPPRSFWQTNLPFTVSATLRNFSAEARTIRATCVADEAPSVSQELTLEGKSTREVSFKVTPKEFKTVRGVIRAEPADEFAADNERFFVVPPCRPVRVGRLGRGGPERDVFLQTALLPQAGGKSDRYRWVTVTGDNPKPLREQIDVLVLDQGLTPPPAVSDAVRQFVTSGSSVLLLLGEAAQLETWEQDWLAIEIGPRREAGTLADAQHFARINHNHPILKPFFLPRGGDLFRIKVRAWREFRAPAGESLISLASGNPILATLGRGETRIVVFAFPFTRKWSDWPIQATFLPAVHRTIEWLIQRNAAGRELRVGEPGPGGASTKAPGFCAPPDASDSALAVNLDPRESDLARWTMLASFKQLENPNREAAPMVVAPSTAAASARPAGDRTHLLWWFLLAAMLCSLPELCLANRTPR